MEEENVIFHLSDWSYRDKYYEMPKSLLLEFKKKLETIGLQATWDWFTTQVDYDEKGDKPAKFGKVDMTLQEFFLDWEHPLECLVEWDAEL